MKIEVRCSTCSRAYLIEEGALAPDLVCPSCSTPMQVSKRRSAGKPQAKPRPQRPQRPPQPPAAAPAASAAAAPVASAAAAPAASAAAAPVTPPAQPAQTEEVVCPRCKLHFVPSRARQTVRAEQRLSILVVEDMDYFREIAVESLSGRYDVKTATNVVEARAAITAGGIDLMVLDLTLDGGDHGIELLRTMSAKPCPIVIYTAQDESEMYGESWDELRALGADDLVIKGMNVGESLLRKVATLLGQEIDEED